MPGKVPRFADWRRSSGRGGVSGAIRVGTRLPSRATQQVVNWDRWRPQRTIRKPSHLNPLGIVAQGDLVPSLLYRPSNRGSVTFYDTLALGTAPRLSAGHTLLTSPVEVKRALGYFPQGAEWVSPLRPAVLISLGPSQLWRVEVTRVTHRRRYTSLEYAVRRNHEFPLSFQTPRSPVHLVILDRPVERLRFTRFSECEVFGQLVAGDDGRMRLLELPELGLLEDEAYSLNRRAWAWRGSFRARVADAWVHEGNDRTHLEFDPDPSFETYLRLVGADVQRALQAHVGAAVSVRGLVQNATRRIVPWTISHAFLEEAPLLFDANGELVAA